jgi:hypothetical protein
MPGQSEISTGATRKRPSARDGGAALGIFSDPDLIATAGIGAIGLLVTAILIRTTEGADLALAILAPLN